MPSATQIERLIIVSNRLPVSIEDKAHGEYELKPSCGGLVTGLKGLSNSGVEFLWFGWPGREIPKENVSPLSDTLLKEHNAIPVLLDQHTSELYYDGFSSTYLSRSKNRNSY
jgi:trehalose 6-phosphate synthase